MRNLIKRASLNAASEAVERETTTKNRVCAKNDNSRNIIGKALCGVMLTVAAVNFFSCGKDADPVPDYGSGETVTLASQISAPQTRATAENTWAGGEVVRVNVNSPLNFTAAADGTLTPASPLYWQAFSSGITASAWYPASGYSFPRDQSGGLQAADFIFADEVSGITSANYATKALTFKHKTAKVTARLVDSEDLDLSGATVKFSGYEFVTDIDTTSTKTGAISGAGTLWITPNDTVALLIPRTYSQEPFIKVTVDGNDYLYTADLTLEAGKSYTFTITVNKARLALLQSTIADWDDDGNTTVTAEVYAWNGDTAVVINGITWATCNVDAPGTFAAAPESYGMHYQWGRSTGWYDDDGTVTGALKGGGTTTTWDSSVPVGTTWESDNDPCPAGYRVPSNIELGSLADETYTSNVWTQLNGVNGRLFTDKNTGNSLFLPAAGSRNWLDGTIEHAGILGGYRMNTYDGGSAYYNLYLSDVSAYFHSWGGSGIGWSVRCVAEVAE